MNISCTTYSNGVCNQSGPDQYRHQYCDFNNTDLHQCDQSYNFSLYLTFILFFIRENLENKQILKFKHQVFVIFALNVTSTFLGDRLTDFFVLLID